MFLDHSLYAHLEHASGPEATFKGRLDKLFDNMEVLRGFSGGDRTDAIDGDRDGREIHVPVLAAGDPVAAPPQLTTGAAIGLIESVDPVEQSRGWQALRIDVPVLGYMPGGRRISAILGLVMVAPGDDGGIEGDGGERDPVIDGEFLKANVEFRRGVSLGRNAALKLLRGHGVSSEILEPIESARFLILGCGELVRRTPNLTDGSAALPVALGVIAWAAQALGVELGARSATASGVIRGTSPASMPVAQAVAKVEAVKKHGVYDRLITPPLEADADAVEDVIPAATLQQAAAAMWPDGWPELQAELLGESVRVGHWSPGVGREGLTFPTVEVEGQAVPIHVDTSIASKVISKLRQLEGRRVHLVGGPAQSGKSVIGRDVAEGLAEVGWKTWWLLRPDIRTESLSTLAGQVRTAASASPGQTLVILDDLDIRQHATDLDELSLALEATGVSCLVLYRVGRGPGQHRDWKMESCNPMQAFGDASSVAEVVRDVADRAAELLGEESLGDEVIEGISSGPDTDLGVAAALAIHLIQTGARVANEDALDELMSSRLPDTPGLREQSPAWMIRLSVASQLAVPIAAPQDVGTEVLGRLGAVPLRNVDPVPEDPVRWLIPNRRMAESLYRVGVGDGPDRLIGTVRELLVEELSAKGREGRHDRIVEMLLEGASRKGVLDAVLRQPSVSRAIGPWITGATIESLTRVVAVPGMSTNAALACLHQLAERLTTPGPADHITVRKLTMGIQALRFHKRIAADDRQFTQLLEQLPGELNERLPGILSGSGASVPDRVALMAQLVNFMPEDRGWTLVTSHLAEFVAGADPDRAADFHAVAKALSLTRVVEVAVDDGAVRLLTQETEDDHEAAFAAEGAEAGRQALTDVIPSISKLLEKPDPGARLDVLLGWLKLARYRRQWQDTALAFLLGKEDPDSPPPLVQALNRATTHEIGVAFELLTSADRTLAHHFYYRLKANVTQNSGDHRRLIDLVEQKLREATTLSEVTVLVGAVAGAHPLRAFEMLTDRDGQPQPRLLRHTVNLAWDNLDAREAGRLLNLAFDLDEVFAGGSGGGFAGRFAERLDDKNGELKQEGGRSSGFVAHAISTDQRGMLLFHLVRGLARCGWPGLDDLADDLLALIWSRVARGRSDGPRLLLHLSEVGSIGPALLERFRAMAAAEGEQGAERRTWLKKGLRRTDDVELAGAYHELVNALDRETARELAVDFREHGLTRSLDALAEERKVDRVFPVCATISRTLRCTGIEDPVEWLMSELELRLERSRDQKIKEWAGRVLGGVSPQGWATQALGSLRSFDPVRAARIVACITPAEENDMRAQLEAQLWRNVFFTRPDAALRLLGLLERIKPESGKRILASLIESHADRFSLIENEMRTIPGPIDQAVAYGVAAQLGWHLDEDKQDRAWGNGLRLRVEVVRGSRATRALARWLEAWSASPRWLETFRWDLIARRIENGRSYDLEQVPALIDTVMGMTTLGGDARVKATQLAEALLKVDDLDGALRRLSTGSLSLAVRSVGDLAADGDRSMITLHGKVLDAAELELERRLTTRAVSPGRAASHLGHLARAVPAHRRPRLGEQSLDPYLGVDPVLTGWALAPVADGPLRVRLAEIAEIEANRDVISPTARPLLFLTALDLDCTGLAERIVDPELWRARPAVLELLGESLHRESCPDAARTALTEGKMYAEEHLTGAWTRTSIRAGAARKMLNIK